METSIKVPVDTFKSWISYIEGYEWSTNQQLGIREEMQQFLNKATYIAEAPPDKEKLVGTLTKAWGLKDWKTAEIGHPVYEINNRYVIHLESNAFKTKSIPFKKVDLQPIIKFNE